MSTPSDSMEEKIILATIDCIEQFGVQATTNRKIAEIAGINSAAVNYYFRSKEVLLQKVMERTLDNAFDWSDFNKIEATSAKARCEAIFLDILSGGINYPGITHAHFYNLVNFGDYTSEVVARLNKFVPTLAEDMLQHGYTGDRAELNLSCYQMSYAVFMAVLIPKLFLNLNLEKPENQKQFVHSLMEKLF